MSPQMSEHINELAERVREVIRLLKVEYPDARCTLDFQTPHQLLVAAILAAQCTDEKVNQITPALFRKYPSAEAFASADIVEIQETVKPTGFFRMKAKAIIESSQDIVAKFGGQVPDTINDLLTLRGVGRKTANLIVGVAYGKPALIVDTHVKRVAYRLGLTKQKDPDKIELDLRQIVPEQDSTHFNHWIVFHGRAICKAPKPSCAACVLVELCPYGKKELGIGG